MLPFTQFSKIIIFYIFVRFRDFCEGGGGELMSNYLSIIAIVSFSYGFMFEFSKHVSLVQRD